MELSCGRKSLRWCFFLMVISCPVLVAGAEPTTTAPASQPTAAADGFHLWACPTPPVKDAAIAGESEPPFVFRSPRAVHVPDTQKTFFVYVGTAFQDNAQDAKPRPVVLAAFFDHQSGTVTRPVIVCQGAKAEGCPEAALALDEQGYLYVFVSNGPKGRSYIYRSHAPHAIDGFKDVYQASFANPQPWYLPKHGFLLVHLQPREGKNLLCFSTSPDGRAWSEPQVLADLAGNHRMVSGRYNDKVGVAFAYEEQPSVPTDLFYLETANFGSSWRTTNGTNLELPLTKPDNPALIRDYRSINSVVYPKDLNFDRMGNPTVVYLSTAGPKVRVIQKRRLWHTARWFRDWEITGLISSDHNLDAGCLHITKEYQFRLIAPTLPGPQPDLPGGDILMWISDDQGRSWGRYLLTADKQFNHQDARRPFEASDDLYVFWASGDMEKGGHGRIFYCNKRGAVFLLPEVMDGPTAKPIEVPVQR